MREIPGEYIENAISCADEIVSAESSHFEDKQSIRIRLKELRADIPPDVRKKLSERIASNLLPLLEGYTTIMMYVSKPPEVETTPLISRFISENRKVIVPIIQREDCSLRLSYLRNPELLTESTFNVPEPIGHEIPASAEVIEAAIIPLIGFDTSGHRLGYGAGYYDRFLEKNPDILKIGLAFSCQQVECVPHEAFDITMDSIVTEKTVIRCASIGSK